MIQIDIALELVLSSRLRWLKEEKEEEKGKGRNRKLFQRPSRDFGKCVVGNPYIQSKEYRVQYHPHEVFVRHVKRSGTWIVHLPLFSEEYILFPRETNRTEGEIASFCFCNTTEDLIVVCAVDRQ